MSDFIWFFIGLAFGVIFMVNRKDYKTQKTVEQLDEELRKELALNKNLVESLRNDLSWAKQTIANLKERK